MRALVFFFRGYAIVELTGAEPERCLNRFAQRGIAFWDVEKPDELHLRCRVLLRDVQAAEQAAMRELCTLECLKQCGFRAVFYGVLARPVLVAGLLLAVALTLFLQNYVWFLQVQGNETIPAQEILRELDDLGVHFGTKGSDIDSQMLKNQMLNRIPALQWLAVNRSGGVVTVLVSEREPDATNRDRRVAANVVAKRAGVITSMSVLNGFAQVQSGDAVLAGQLLVSGVASWETHTQVTRAMAEIYAMTLHEQQVTIPAEYAQKVYTGREYRHVSLIFGRKRINLSGNSGIFSGTCDKMIDSRVLTLPGGYVFPLTVETEIVREYELQPEKLPQSVAQALLTEYIQNSVRQSMVAGTILQEDYRLTKAAGGYVLSGALSCEEMIARTVPLPLMGEDGEIGTDDQRGAN